MRIDGQRTRAKIIDTAELLYAEKGIDNVTLLSINKAAGQSNRNAAKYYFQNKQGLLEAVLKKHALQINERRLELLANLEQRDDAGIEDVMSAIVSPLGAKLSEGASGIAYIRINGQLMVNPEFSSLRTKLGIDLRNNARLDEMFRRFIPDASREVRDFRSLLVENLMYHGLSAFASRHLRNSRRSAASPTRDPQEFITELVRALSAIIDR